MVVFVVVIVGVGAAAVGSGGVESVAIECNVVVGGTSRHKQFIKGP